MDRYYKWKVLLIIAIVVFSIWKVHPIDQKINLGLDLQGGMQLLLQVDLDKVPAEHRQDATDRVVEIIRNRIDEFGVREPVITKQGKEQVVVQLPGVTDRDRAKEIVGKTAHLEFRFVADNPDVIAQADAAAKAALPPPPVPEVPKVEAPAAVATAGEAVPKAVETTSESMAKLAASKLANAKMPEGYEFVDSVKNQGAGAKLLLSKESVLSGDHLTNASVGFDQYGQPIVQLQFDTEGAKIFDRVTFQNVGKQLAIVLDGRVHSAPVIRDRIPNGQAQISGSFTSDEASDLSLVLRAGALPAPVHVIEERTVGPTLGRDSIEKGVKSGLLGAGLVFLFMPIYYMLCGLVANVGLIVYVIMVMGSLAIFHSSLTLPGIAGFILSIGMAVDANVLIYERMREEISTGKTARAAISAGYHRAFAAILDSNITTLITSLLLFLFGTGPIKGFAVTLSFGLIASMFSSLTVTRVVLDFLASRNPNIKFNMLHLIGTTNIRFLKGRFFAYGFSVLTLVVGVGSFFLRGHENFGVEFTGGTMIQMQFQKPVETSELRKALTKEGIVEPSIQIVGQTTTGAASQFLVKTRESSVQKIEKAGKEIDASYQTLKVDQVGPSVSGDLKTKALWAVFWSVIGILIYLAVRFEMRFAFAAVVALLHDTLFTAGVYALSGREINLPIVAAILTIMGYSINDTIITFDRVRENMKTVRKKSFSEIVELSINQTLGRTILTSLTVLFCAVALFLFGGSGINDFAFTLCIGFTIGIYSTVFVASALLVDWSGRRTAPAVPVKSGKPEMAVKRK